MNTSTTPIRRTSCWAAMLLCLGLGSSAARADGSPIEVKTDALLGSALRNGAHVTMRWSTWVDAPLEKVRARVTTWEHTLRLVKDAKEIEVHRRAKDTARFGITRKAPVFFMPDPTVVFDATCTEADGGAVVIEWNLIEGLPKQARRRWTLKAEHGGTRVEHHSTFDFPFSPPKVLFDEPSAELSADVERFRKLVGATRALRKAPAPAAAPGPAPAPAAAKPPA